MKDKNLLIMLAALVIVVAFVLAFGLNRESINRQPLTHEQEIEQIENQSTSNDPEDIEKDLMDTELEDLDRELEDIEQELEQEY